MEPTYEDMAAHEGHCPDGCPSVRPVAVHSPYGSPSWMACHGCRYYGPRFTVQSLCAEWISHKRNEG